MPEFSFGDPLVEDFSPIFAEKFFFQKFGEWTPSTERVKCAIKGLAEELENVEKVFWGKREGLTEDLEDLDDVEKVGGEKREGCR